MSEARDLSLCFVGYMAGARPGFTTSQGYILSELMRRAGQRVERVSTKQNCFLRLLDIARHLVGYREDSGVIVLEVYGGRNFYLVDVASALAGRSGAPVVMVLHGGSLPNMFRERTAWTKRVLQRADVLVAPSEYLARAVRETHRMEADVIPNLISLDEYPFRLRNIVAPRLFWMRSFHPVYNPEMAIRAFARIRQRYPGATLIMAGRGDGTEQCKALARELKVIDAVEFPGFIGRDQKVRFGQECDIFLNTNRIDNMPVAVLEACAFGLPVVSTRVGGVPDLLESGKTGLLVDDGDDAAMADAVTRLIEEPALAESLSANGRRLAELSSQEVLVPRWTRLFEQAHARRQQRRQRSSR